MLRARRPPGQAHLPRACFRFSLITSAGSYVHPFSPGSVVKADSAFLKGERNNRDIDKTIPGT